MAGGEGCVAGASLKDLGSGEWGVGLSGTVTASAGMTRRGLYFIFLFFLFGIRIIVLGLVWLVKTPLFCGGRECNVLAVGGT
jgi:hypothetical protein